MFHREINLRPRRYLDSRHGYLHRKATVETTQEKIISLELTTSPSSETAPDLEEGGISLGETEGGESSLQPDIVQVVNPLLDGGAGRVTAISVGPAQRLTAYTEQN